MKGKNQFFALSLPARLPRSLSLCAMVMGTLEEQIQM
jgi:hypothetical protein